MSIDIQQLSELERKATPGPWEVDYLDKAWQRVVRAEHYEIFTGWHHSVGSIEVEMEANAALIVAMRNALPALLASLASKDAEIERLKAERENARSEASHVAKMFLRHRDLLLEIRDKIADESDRCYFGSTNHADYFRDVAAEMDDYAWDRYMRATKWPDYIEKSRKANTRAEAAESRLTTALAALGEAREALEPFDFYDFDPADGWSDNDQLEIYVAETAMDAGKLLHRMKVCDLRKARTTLAKLNALEGNEDG